MQGSATIFRLKLYYFYIFSLSWMRNIPQIIFMFVKLYCLLPTTPILIGHSNIVVLCPVHYTVLMEEILTKDGLSEPGSPLFPLSQLLRLLTSSAHPVVY